jgi:eukaryotic-like serine/threonine-protein kinase
MLVGVSVCGSCHTVVAEREARFCPACGQALESSPPSRLGEGTLLPLGYGEVLLGEVIGEGGMGIVRKGWLRYARNGSRCGTPDHPVAIKILNPLLRGRERARRLFVGEGMALDRVSHPNIVHFFGMTDHLGQMALVMEWVEGAPLSDLIRSHIRERNPSGLPCMPMVPAWHHFSQLLGALAAIHALGIVHRDVKPSNILIRVDGMTKLTDFGIARLPASAARLSGGLAPGTGAYMSPEQVTAGHIDARSDLYSAAIVLFEMLTGRTPFDDRGRSELAIRTAQLEEPAPALTALVPQAPPILDLLMARALAKDPMHRFPNAIEFGEALRQSLGLPDSPGWIAQRRLAGAAARLSRSASTAPERTADEEEALRLRTDVMQAYGT